MSLKCIFCFNNKSCLILLKYVEYSMYILLCPYVIHLASTMIPSPHSCPTVIITEKVKIS